MSTIADWIGKLADWIRGRFISRGGVVVAKSKPPQGMPPFGCPPPMLPPINPGPPPRTTMDRMTTQRIDKALDVVHHQQDTYTKIHAMILGVHSRHQRLSDGSEPRIPGRVRDVFHAELRTSEITLRMVGRKLGARNVEGDYPGDGIPHIPLKTPT